MHKMEYIISLASPSGEEIRLIRRRELSEKNAAVEEAEAEAEAEEEAAIYEAANEGTKEGRKESDAMRCDAMRCEARFENVRPPVASLPSARKVDSSLDETRYSTSLNPTPLNPASSRFNQPL